MKTTAVLNNCTLCIIKPHIIRDGQLGQVIDMILQAGFEISAAEMFYMSRAVIEEFYSVYKGILPEYLPLIEHISNGPSVALCATWCSFMQNLEAGFYRACVGAYEVCARTDRLLKALYNFVEVFYVNIGVV